jgi:hypothetical protein
LLTADTITNAQLEELRRDSRMRVRVMAKLALGEAVTYKSPELVHEARERCAQLLNHRALKETSL